jgi:dihydrodipicolinate reductase
MPARGGRSIRRQSVIPVLIAPNTSVGVNVMARLVWLATRALGEGYDVEIAEAHHRMKRDAPSGTALALGEAVAAARGRTLASVAVYDRQGQRTAHPRQHRFRGGARRRHRRRTHGDLAGDGERLEITHRATDRATFARGALRAANGWPASPPACTAWRCAWTRHSVLNSMDSASRASLIFAPGNDSRIQPMKREDVLTSASRFAHLRKAP